MEVGATFEFRSDNDVRDHWFTKIIVAQGDSKTEWKMGVARQDPTCRKPVLTFSSEKDVRKFVAGEEVEVRADYLLEVSCLVRNYRPPPDK